MIQTIKKQFQVQWRDWLWEFASSFIAWMAGFGMLHLIMADDGTSWLAVGTLLGGVIAGIVSLLVSVFSLGILFNTQVGMGCTRRRFFISYYLVGCTMNLLLVLFLILLCAVESALCARIYPGMGTEFDLMPWLWKAGIPAALAIPAAGGFCGALILRFGKKAFWALWCVWMFVFLGVPNISNAVEDAPSSFFGMLGRQAMRAFGAVPASAWILLGAAAVLLCFGGSWLLLRRQQVTV